jgi:putative two-component system response regulator
MLQRNRCPEVGLCYTSAKQKCYVARELTPSNVYNENQSQNSILLYLAPLGAGPSFLKERFTVTERDQTVVVADDDLAGRTLLCTILAARGYKVICVADGSEALKLLKTHEIDLVLLDVVMPEAKGFQICQEMKSKPETRLIPVVLVTGLTSEEDRIQGTLCGADDFLSKPISRQELLARVQSLLRLKKFTDELDNAETVLLSLALSIEAKDPYTEGHCDRLSRHSVRVAETLGLAEHLRVALRRGGLVHDIGKLAVPEHILLKPGPLTQEERKIMERHTVAGERICAPLRSFAKSCRSFDIIMKSGTAQATRTG